MSIQAIDLNPIQYFDKSGILMLYSSLIWPVLHVLQRYIQLKKNENHPSKYHPIFNNKLQLVWNEDNLPKSV